MENAWRLQVVFTDIPDFALFCSSRPVVNVGVEGLVRISWPEGERWWMRDTVTSLKLTLVDIETISELLDEADIPRLRARAQSLARGSSVDLLISEIVERTLDLEETLASFRSPSPPHSH